LIAKVDHVPEISSQLGPPSRTGWLPARNFTYSLSRQTWNITLLDAVPYTFERAPLAPLSLMRLRELH